MINDNLKLFVLCTKMGSGLVILALSIYGLIQVYHDDAKRRDCDRAQEVYFQKGYKAALTGDPAQLEVLPTLRAGYHLACGVP